MGGRIDGGSMDLSNARTVTIVFGRWPTHKVPHVIGVFAKEIDALAVRDAEANVNPNVSRAEVWTNTFFVQE